MTHHQNFAAMGKLSWLWMNSKLHADWSTRLMMRNLIPPISLGQFEILEKDGMPVAYASWAFLSPEAELRYIKSPSKIQLEDWTSGDRMWFIDYVSPFSARHTLELKSRLRGQFGDRFARSLRVTPGCNTARVVTYFGREVQDGWRQSADTQILSHFATKS